MLTLRPDPGPVVRDRNRGALIGLAVGDAVGTTVEFVRPGSFPPVTDMTGGGPFRLQAGDWTDDTSMALCLADSLVERRGFDPRDQMTRYVRWWREGYLSSTDTCFDIGNTVSAALRAFEKSGEPFSGSTHEQSAGNGSLMRLAPIPMFYVGRPEDAIAMAGESSRTTHGAAVAIDACRYLAALIIGAIHGVTKEELCAPQFTPVAGYWDEHPLHPVIADIANGSFTTKSPPAIRGTGYAADSLEAALWAFHHATDFRDGCLRAVNLGDDADTTAAVYGQLAGACFGESGIPHEWRARLAHKELINDYADALLSIRAMRSLALVAPSSRLPICRPYSAASLPNSSRQCSCTCSVGGHSWVPLASNTLTQVRRSSAISPTNSSIRRTSTRSFARSFRLPSFGGWVIP